MTTKAPYKKRLQEHLKQTKDHARQVKRRIKELGGKAEAGPVSSGPDVLTEAATTATSLASKAVAAAQGPLHAIRGTGEAEKMLKNARTEYHNEFEEIGFYTGIEALAETVGDKETAKLARDIRRDEEKMAKFLEKQIPQLAKAVAREEIPAAERRNGSSRSSSRRRSTSRSRSSSNGSSRSGSSRSSASRSSSSSSRSRSSSSRSGASKSSSRSGASKSRSRSAASRSGASKSRSRTTASRTGASKSRSSSGGSKRSGSSRSKTASKARSK